MFKLLVKCHKVNEGSHNIFKNSFIYLFVFGCAGSLLLHLVAESEGYTLVAESGLLIAVVSLVVEHGLRGLSHCILSSPLPTPVTVPWAYINL